MQIITKTILVVLLALLAACSRFDEPVSVTTGDNVVTFCGEWAGNGSRTIYELDNNGANIKWEEGDEIAVHCVYNRGLADEQTVVGRRYRAAVDPNNAAVCHFTPVTPKDNIEWQAGKTHTFYAEYNGSEGDELPTERCVTLSNNQTQSEAGSTATLKEYMTMHAVPVERNSDNRSEVALHFYNLKSVVMFEIALQSGSKSLSEMQLITTDNKPLVNSVTLYDMTSELTGGDYNAVTSLGPKSKSATYNAVSLTFNGNQALSTTAQRFFMVMEPAAHAAGKLTLQMLFSDGTTISRKFNSAVTFKSNTIHRKRITLNDNPDVPATKLGVMGKCIDLRTVNGGINKEGIVFPINDYLTFPSTMPLDLVGKRYATGIKEYSNDYGSLYNGVEFFGSQKAQTVYLATTHTISEDGWTDTGESFTLDHSQSALKDMRYRLYSYSITGNEGWIEVPKSNYQSYSALLFAEGSIEVCNTTDYGTTVAKSYILRSTTISNPTIVITPDGHYLAACNGANTDKNGGNSMYVSFYKSTDKGLTWSLISYDQVELGYGKLFVHNGATYIMGTQKVGTESSHTGHIAIHRSDDNGKTWTTATDASTGLLFTDAEYHSAPVPMPVYNGRIWRAFEDKERTKAFVISAPADSDLLNAANWTMTNQVAFDTSWAVNSSGTTGDRMIEGNMVVLPDGNGIVNLLRVDESDYGSSALIMNVTDENTVSLDPSTAFVNMPGGSKKFTVNYDPVSKKYWAIVNPMDRQYYRWSVEGFYDKGITGLYLRNIMTLCYSYDLRTWHEARTIISKGEPFFHGFQYVDWVFDGDDIAAVSRTAAPESRGLPIRQHDANMMTFHRIRSFRDLSILTDTPVGGIKDITYENW